MFSKGASEWRSQGQWFNEKKKEQQECGVSVGWAAAAHGFSLMRTIEREAESCGERGARSVSTHTLEKKVCGLGPSLMSPANAESQCLSTSAGWARSHIHTHTRIA